jgi:hypothetical protein
LLEKKEEHAIEIEKEDNNNGDNKLENADK